MSEQKPKTNWIVVAMAGVGGAVIQIDPTLAPYTLIILIIKGFLGASVMAFFGNHYSTKRAAKKLSSQTS